MQTFLPFPEDFKKSAKTLDNKRLSKQLTEAYQIIRCIEGTSNGNGWKYHPAVRMWVGYIQSLKYYYNCILDELYERKKVGLIKSQKSRGEYYTPLITPMYIPYWLNNPLIKISHQSNLARKNPVQYPFKDYGLIGYYWPVKTLTKKSTEIKQQWVDMFKDSIDLIPYFNEENFFNLHLDSIGYYNDKW